MSFGRRGIVRRKMKGGRHKVAKRKNRLFSLMGLIGLSTIFGSIGLGELFLSGTFLDGVVLGFFPEMIHLIVGWLIIIGGLISGFKTLGWMK